MSTCGESSISQEYSSIYKHTTIYWRVLSIFRGTEPTHSKMHCPAQLQIPLARRTDFPNRFIGHQSRQKYLHHRSIHLKLHRRDQCPMLHCTPALPASCCAIKIVRCSILETESKDSSPVQKTKLILHCQHASLKKY